jgi:hypothetical protein
MTQFRAQTEYLRLYQLHCERYDRALKIVSAVSSSASIGAWAIWNTLSWVWGTIIAASQVLTAVKPYLPFEQRLKATGELASKFERLFLQFEATWQDVAAGELREDQISDKLGKLKQLATDAFESCIKSPLPQKAELRDRAAQVAEEYFNAIYT